MKRKFISILTLLCMIITLLPSNITVYAATNGTCGDNATWTLDDDGTLTISGTGDMWDWNFSFHAPWYSSNKKIKSVIISDGVKNVGENAFIYCSNLTSITIPDSVMSIGNSAFSQCTSLMSINVDANNENYCSVDGNLFNKVKTELVQYAVGKSDTQYKIPAGVTNIGNSAFSWCSSLKSVTISDGVTSVGNSAFSYCSGLTSITIPDSVTTIGTMALSGCSGITSVTIGSGVTQIGKYAFYYCFGLTDVYYNGSEADWNNIQIGDGNNYLTNAKRTYITATEKSTKTTPSADGKSFVVKAENISNGNVIVIALYDGDKIIDTQSAVYSGSDVTFGTDKAYTAAKVMVWENMSNIAPVCDVEIVK